MQIGNHIKKYRNELGLSQDELSEKVYVSRQTISNWENDKSYPDVESLLLLSEIFHVSLDTLIKGDIDKMKEKINEMDKKEFERVSQIFSALFIFSIISLVPLMYLFNYVGIFMWGVIYAITMYYGFKVEKYKKQFDIQTYREIVAFSEGQTLDEIAKARESGKRPYQKVNLAIITAIITIAIAILMAWIFHLI